MPVVVDGDGDLRRDAGLLAGVEGVVDQLLEDDQRPRVTAMPGLRDKLLLGAKSRSRLVRNVSRCNSLLSATALMPSRLFACQSALVLAHPASIPSANAGRWVDGRPKQAAFNHAIGRCAVQRLLLAA